MFIKFGLVVLYKNFNECLKVSERLSHNSSHSRIYIALDELWCMFVYGTSFTEYQALNFLNRTRKNRKTFVTVAWLLEQIKKFNPERFREVFHDKCQFNRKFKDYLGRDFLEVTEGTTDEELRSFLSKQESVVIKGAHGCSGKEVMVLNDLTNLEASVGIIRSGSYNLIEQKIINISTLAALNPTSLNTCRIVTCHGEGYFKVLFACLRIGSKGALIDNATQGGTAAKIDLETGVISSLFKGNAFRVIENSQIGRNEKGLQIPYWKETLSMLKEACKLVPEIHLVGWDVAITPTGPTLIEGNESFDSALLQYWQTAEEEGIKKQFREALIGIPIHRDIK